MKFFLLNGPPSSGKDEAAMHVYDEDINIFERFSAPLKTSFAAISGREIDEFYRVEYYEDNKEEDIPWLGGTTFRNYQINLSEGHFKPSYGSAIFASLFWERAQNRATREGKTIFLVPDLGFEVETIYLEQQESLLDNDVLNVRIHRDGTDFTGDSRSYVPTYRFNTINVSNNDTLEAFQDKISIIYETFVNNTENLNIVELLDTTTSLVKDEYGYY